MNLPLSGTRIIDLGMYVAGPYASVPLAELGADVIKIEPITGDPNRGVWRAFSCTNRGKRSIAIDLKNPKGLAIAKRLCTQADIVHHNFRPGVPERLGIGYEELKKENPELIFLEASAYGDTGPMSKMPGFDMMMQAMCGQEAASAGEGNDPLWLRWAPVDFTGGYLSTIGILAAIYRKLKSGDGGIIKTNLLDGGLFILSELIKDNDGQFKGVNGMNATQTGTKATEALYLTNDEWICVVARTDDQQTALASLIGLSNVAELADSEQAIADYFSTLSAETALENLTDKGIWAELCRQNVDKDIYNSPAWADTGMVRTYPHARNGNIKQLGNMVRLSDISPAPEKTGRVPELGEDSKEILTNMGFSDEEISDLYEQKIVA